MKRSCELKSEIKQILNYCINKIKSREVLPFSGLSLCRCLDSRARLGWRGSHPHSPCETHPHAGAEGTERLPRSRGWHHGSVLMCTETKAMQIYIYIFIYILLYQWHHAAWTQYCTDITARLFSLQQCWVYTDGCAAGIKSKKIIASHCDLHKKCVGPLYPRTSRWRSYSNIMSLKTFKLTLLLSLVSAPA